MKTPVKIDDLMDEWAKDSKMDIELNGPDAELEKIPSLHAKYLNVLSFHNLLIKKYRTEYAKMKKFKTEYYSGDLNNPEDLEKHGLQPAEKKAGRNIALYLDADDDLTQIGIKISIHEEIVDYCKAIIRELTNRTFQVKAIIDWRKFTGGV